MSEILWNVFTLCACPLLSILCCSGKEITGAKGPTNDWPDLADLLRLLRSLSAGRSEKASFMTLVTSWVSWREISGFTWKIAYNDILYQCLTSEDYFAQKLPLSTPPVRDHWGTCWQYQREAYSLRWKDCSYEWRLGQCWSQYWNCRLAEPGIKSSHYTTQVLRYVYKWLESKRWCLWLLNSFPENFLIHREFCRKPPFHYLEKGFLKVRRGATTNNWDT